MALLEYIHGHIDHDESTVAYLMNTGAILCGFAALACSVCRGRDRPWEITTMTPMTTMPISLRRLVLSTPASFRVATWVQFETDVFHSMKRSFLPMDSVIECALPAPRPLALHHRRTSLALCCNSKKT